MKKENKHLLFMFIRYLVILAVAIPNLFLFYSIFTPLTIYPVNAVLNLLYGSSINGNIITSSAFSIEIIEACVAGSAFYLLFLLNFATPMNTKKRVYSLIFSLLLFLVVNIARIVIFAMLLSISFKLFDITHTVTWYFVSGVIVFLVWIFTIRTFKIKETPFSTDIKFIYSKTKPTQRKK